VGFLDLVAVLSVVGNAAQLGFYLHERKVAALKADNVTQQLVQIDAITSAAVTSGATGPARSSEFFQALRDVQMIARTDDRTPQALVGKQWIIPSDDLLGIEAAQQHDVWIVTKDLEPDLTESETQSVVLSNLRRGISYVYFVPEEIEPTRLQALKDALDGQGNKVKYVLLPRTRPEFQVDNVTVLLKDMPSHGRYDVFEEVTFVAAEQRGLYWKHSTTPAWWFDTLKRHLDEKETP
jgi:hypothetical protein